MRIIEDLRAEHDLIEQVAGSFLTWAEALGRGEAVVSDGGRFVQFFRRYAAGLHHAKEEDTLFAALRDRAFLPADRGPIAVLSEDHRRMAAQLEAIARALDGLGAGDAARTTAPAGTSAPTARPPEAGDVLPLARLVAEYVHALWHHIDAENSVLLPESEGRLAKHGVTDLPSRPPTADEAAAEASGRALVARYAPATDPSVVRGDGCVCCQAFGERCGGVEREWWNEWE